MYKILSVSMDIKTIKGEKYGYLTGILYMSPDRSLCPCCTEGCRKSCLFTAGHGAMKTVQLARMKRNGLWYNHRELFKQYLIEDIERLIKEAGKKGLKPCVRINGTSDIDVQKEFGDVLDRFPAVMFYDYTKCWGRYSHKANYYLIYSYSERRTKKDVDLKLEEGYNVAVVFDKVPETWEGRIVIKGDDSDLRFLDQAGVIVGLTAKGKARRDDTGFVVRVGGTST